MRAGYEKDDDRRIKAEREIVDGREGKILQK